MDNEMLKYLLMVAWDSGFYYARKYPDCTDARQALQFKSSDIELIMEENS
jgi:hypothetical protein